jgi:hypothetical protein
VRPSCSHPRLGAGAGGDALNTITPHAERTLVSSINAVSLVRWPKPYMDELQLYIDELQLYIDELQLYIDYTSRKTTFLAVFPLG